LIPSVEYRIALYVLNANPPTTQRDGDAAIHRGYGDRDVIPEILVQVTVS
jgi:hypothetical protein